MCKLVGVEKVAAIATIAGQPHLGRLAIGNAVLIMCMTTGTRVGRLSYVKKKSDFALRAVECKCDRHGAKCKKFVNTKDFEVETGMVNWLALEHKGDFNTHLDMWDHCMRAPGLVCDI